jgi:beta-lactamase superfamily II metal-dependent hydrolase
MARQPIVIDFWDVGQGDATVIRPTPNRAFIIDVGPRNSPIVDWIAQHPRISIDGVVLTHNDADHAGAIAALIDAARSRIGTVYFLVDRGPKDKGFAQLFARLHQAFRAGEIKGIFRLEAPQRLWSDPTDTVHITVRYPDMVANVSATGPNQTSGILTLDVSGHVRVVWAGDAPIAEVSNVCSGSHCERMVGPHHGAPSDRADPATEARLKQIGARLNFISVGSNNRYEHPQKSYLRKAIAAGSQVICTQLTRLCDRDRVKDVVKSHARYALPHPNTGTSCRGTARVMLLSDDDIIGDDLDSEHQREIRNLQRPQCILLTEQLQRRAQIGVRH